MRRLVTLIAVVCLFISGAAFAQEKAAEVTKDAAKAEAGAAAATPPADAAAVAPAAPAAPDAAVQAAPAQAPAEQSFPVDERKITVTIKMKDGRNMTGIVRHFLVADRVPDYLSEPTFMVADGPTVMGEGTEFVMEWPDVKLIEFNKQNRENGEVSCVEDYDKSPDRKECVIINEYKIVGKKVQGDYVVQNKEMFRIVLTNGKKIDFFLGKFKVTNERDETRDQKTLSTDLESLFKNNVLSISFH